MVLAIGMFFIGLLAASLIIFVVWLATEQEAAYAVAAIGLAALVIGVYQIGKFIVTKVDWL